MLHIEVAPEVEQLLANAARLRGVNLEAYAGELIEAAVLPARPRPLPTANALLEGLLAFADKTPTLSEDAMTRESFYGDRE